MQITQIQLTPEDIEGHIKTAVMNSAIGTSLTRAIKDKLAGWEFDKAIKQVVDEEIPKIIRNVMNEPDKKEMITRTVREALTEQLVIQIANKSIEHLWK